MQFPTYNGGGQLYPIGSIVQSGGSYYLVVNENEGGVECSVDRYFHSKGIYHQYFKSIPKPIYNARGNKYIEAMGGL